VNYLLNRRFAGDAVLDRSGQVVYNYAVYPVLCGETGRGIMGKLFDVNNPVWSTVGKLVDVFILHLFWVICCIPVVTIGPATIALYYALMKVVRDENPHYVKSYFRAFKENMKKGIIVGLIFTVAGGLLGFAIYFYVVMSNATSNTGWQVMKIVSIAFSVIYLFMLQYVYPLMARFENTIGQTLRNALYFSIKNLGWTVMMIVILITPYLVIYYTNFIPLFSIAYGLVVFADSYILNKIFDPYVKAAQGEPEEEKDPDRWVIDDEVLPERKEEAPALTDNTEKAPEETEENK